MTAPPLSPGREMDVAVVQAMRGPQEFLGEPWDCIDGWRVNVPPIHGPGTFETRTFRKYSTDHAAIPELLAFLQPQAKRLYIEIGGIVPDDCSVSVTSWPGGGSIESEGRSLLEALCNAVLALAARRTP